MRVALLAVLVLARCAEKAPSEADERLRAAIADGRWPDQAKKAARDGDPLLIDDDVLLQSLGSHRYDAEATFGYTGEDGEEGSVHETTTLTVAADGRYHLVVDRDYRRVDGPPGTSGREAVWDGERFVTRLRHGQWVVHDPLRREQDAWRRDATDHLATVIRLVGKGLKRTKEGRRITLSLGPWGKPALPKGVSDADAEHHEGDLWYAWWKRAHRATALEGTVTLADTKNVVALADVTLTASTTKTRAPRAILSPPESTETPGLFGGRAPGAPPPEAAPPPPPPAPEAPHAAEATLKVQVHVAVTALKEPPSIALPPDAGVKTARRKRIQHMIDAILGGSSP